MCQNFVIHAPTKDIRKCEQLTRLVHTDSFKLKNKKSIQLEQMFELDFGLPTLTLVMKILTIGIN